MLNTMLCLMGNACARCLVYLPEITISPVQPTLAVYIYTVHVKSYFRPFARSRAWSHTNSTLKSRAIKNEPVLSRASNCVIA